MMEDATSFNRVITVMEEGRDEKGVSDVKSNDSVPSYPPMKLSQGQLAMQILNDGSLTRGDRSWWVIVLSSVLAGIMLSWGGALYVVLGAGTKSYWADAPGLHAVVAASVFPMGLTGIVLTGSDLLTSNMMYAALPFVTMDPRRPNWMKLKGSAKILIISFAFNFISCALMAAYIGAMVVHSDYAVSFVTGIAEKKVAGSLGLRFGKAVAANWLVNIAVFQAATAITVMEKMIILWLPITAFVACGFEHSVANMFLIPLGMYYGADVTVGQFIGHNLIIVILGNFVGAALMVGALHWYGMMPANYWQRREL